MNENIYYSDVIQKLRDSLNPPKKSKFLFHLPFKLVFLNSFFQWADTYENLKEIFFYTLVHVDTNNFSNLSEKELEKIKINVFRIVDQTNTSDDFFKELNVFFISLKFKLRFDENKSYFGTVDNLISDNNNFAIQTRENFRKWLYEINFEKDINIGLKQIEIKESVKFYNFLELATNYE